jgi:hypothetical protein
VVERPPFPFVVGCGRSGTTLVRALLDAHPLLAIPDESYFPIWLGRDRARYERPDGFALARFTEDVIAERGFRQWALDPDEVRRALGDESPTNFADAVRGCFALYARVHGKDRYGDKTPIFVLHIATLARMFPEAVFVHVVRDGRAVALSRIEASWGTERLDHEALLWRAHIEQGRAQGAALGPGRYQEVKYEDLLDEPECVARALCAFVRLPFEPAMLRYHEHAAPLVQALAIPDEHRNLLRPPTKGLRDWRTQITPAQLALFEALAGDTLRTFGYDCASEALSPPIRVRALYARMRYASKTRVRQARAALWRVANRKTRA